MKLVMTTCERQPSYLDATLESLFTSDPTVRKVHVLCHELSPECLGKWECDPCIEYRALQPEELVAKMRLGRRTRVAHATRLALELADGECISLQDDALFDENWLSTFEQELDAFGPDRQSAMIALFHPLRHQVRPGILPWDPRGYYGMVAMYFGEIARKKAVEALQAWEEAPHATESPGMGDDVCLKIMLERSRDVRLYARFPALVQHVGHVSSIASVGKRKAPTFGNGRPVERAPVTFLNPTVKPVVQTSKPRKDPRPPVRFK